MRLQSHPTGQMINLTQKIFSRKTFKLLNKDLNFVPAPNKINQKELNKREEFYRCIKLKFHFQDTLKQVDLSDEEYRFRNKNKHWVPTKVHHTIGPFIEAIKKDTNEQTNEDSEDCHLVTFDIK